LSEGPISIRVVPDNDSSKKKIFFSDVVWIGKPRSLLNPETALNLLEIIEPEEKIDQLLKKDNYKVALDDYWQKLDPTPNTNYNELMNEFYQRVDYCQENFKSIDGSNGAYSDRGKIYIKLGPPDKIERNSSNEDKVVETWFYNKPKKKFVFVDNDGTGKYLLVSEQ
jgi:GWxTD domain-containing protein